MYRPQPKKLCHRVSLDRRMLCRLTIELPLINDKLCNKINQLFDLSFLRLVASSLMFPFL